MQSLVYLTTYDPDLESLGGASWVDRRIIDALRVNFDVKVVLVTSRWESLDHVALEIKNSFPAKLYTVLRMVAKSEPYFFAKFKSDSRWKLMLERIARESWSSRFVVTSQTPALLACREAGVRSDLHLAHNFDAVLAQNHDPLLLRMLRNPSRTKISEVELLAHAAAVKALSKTDADLMREAGINCLHIGALVKSGPARQRRQGRIGFIGKADWPPNRHALETLTEVIMPKVRDRLGSDSPILVLAGRGSEGWQSVEGVEALGEVSSVSEFYESVDLIAVPRMGVSTGVSVKMLEAIESGTMAIVPSALASDAGLAGSVIQADTAEEMSDQIIRFYLNENEIPSVAEACNAEPDLSRALSEFFLGLENAG